MKDGVTMGPADKFAIKGRCFRCGEPFILAGAYANKAAVTGFLLRCHACRLDQIVNPPLPFAIVESFGYIED